MADGTGGAGDAAPPGTVEILLLEDSELDADLTAQRLTLAGIPHRLRHVVSRAEFEAALEDGGSRHDLILADHGLPDFDGLSALAIARERAPEVPFIFVSGVLGEEVAIESLKLGATDYVLKQRLQRLPGAVTRALAESRERAERRRAEEKERLLVDELSHRVKNTLAVVVSIAQQTLKVSGSLDEFGPAFLGRIRALAQAHTLLLGAKWSHAALDALVAESLRPFADPRDGRVEAGGPDVRLDPRMAMSLALTFHELATNAAKYGALRGPRGRIAVRWRTAEEGRRLELSWTERDGPEVQPPRREGFGTLVIRRSVAHELDGTVDLDFPEQGAVCAISLPLPRPAPA